MPPLLPNNPAGTYALRFALLVLLYGLTGYLSAMLIPQSASGALVVWPAAAIGLAGFLFWGLNLWPAVTMGFFIMVLARGGAPSLAAIGALGNTLEALTGAYILMRIGFHPLMSRLRDALGFILASLTSTLVSATVVTVGTMLIGRPFSSALWLGIWIGHAVSLLSFGPFFIRWGYRPLFTKTSQEVIEGVALFGGIATLTFVIFWTPYSSAGNISLIYLLIFALIWASLRTGPRGTSLAFVLISVIGLSGIIWGFGPVTARAAEALFGVQMLIGTLSLIFLLFTSTTEERKNAVIALEGHVGQLEYALQKISSEDKAKAEFIAILAHELRNPLSPVLSGLEILKTREPGQNDIHVMMGAHLHALARLLDDLLDMTRISQKKFKLERETVALQDIIGRSLEMALPYVEERKHSFSKTLPEEAIWIDADPVRLTQVFVNLLNNAAKYTPEGGRISVSLARERGTAVVRVIDNGQGIAQERMHKIFEPFATTARATQGPGGLHIGLSLAKRMAELHQGSIEVKSGGVGEGSEFIVRLPVPDAVQAPLGLTERKQGRGRFSKDKMQSLAQAAGPISVLVVDDNEAAAKMLGTLLEHNGHKVTLAATGMEALESAKETRPNVALLDIGLPDINGYELAKKLRAQFDGDISLIALTGYGQQDDKEKAKKAGFDDHLVKPVSIVDVEHALANLRKSG